MSNLVSSGSPEKPKEADNRSAILDAAESLLSEGGYKKMTIDEIAHRAGLGKGTLYLYFSSKEDIALSIIDRSNYRLREKLKKIARGPGTPRTRVVEMSVLRVLFRLDKVQNHAVAIDDLLECLKLQLKSRRKEWYAAEAMLIAEVLIEGRAQQVLEVEEPHEVAAALIAATNALMPHVLPPEQWRQRDFIEGQARLISELMIRSLESGHRPTQEAPKKRRTTKAKE